MRILGVDLGERRIGIAASDLLGVTAQPVGVVEATSEAKNVARVRERAEERGAGKIVIGLPLNMDGSDGPAARKARRFAAALEREGGLEVELWDERLTTVEAERMLIAAGQRRAKRRQVRDRVAAALILQSYLDAHREGDQG